MHKMLRDTKRFDTCFIVGSNEIRGKNLWDFSASFIICK